MRDPLHLAFFLPSLSGGGAERSITTLANALVERGHRVDLLLTSKRGPFTSSVDSRVSILSFERPHTWQTIPSLIRVLRHRRPDVLVTALLSATAAAYAATSWIRLWGRQAPLPLCATVHALPTALSKAAKGIRARLLLGILPAVLRRVDTVVAVSDAVKRDLSLFSGRAPERIDVVPNPIDVDAIRDAATAPFSHEWLRQSAPVVVAAGRLSPEKAYPLLFRALSRLRQTREVRALILGTGPDREPLDALCRDLQFRTSVSFLGFVDNPYRVMARADLLVLPSSAEAFGNVVVEALACGTPVVATSGSGGPVEILSSLDAPYRPLASPDPSALASAMDTALDASVRETILRRRARDFDVPPIVDRYVSIFNRAIDARFSSR
jgi:glycosyltransferase involved in cell wall biosynthesis